MFGKTVMRLLRIALIPLVPGLLIFSYLWAIDAHVNLATVVPNFFAELAAGALGGGNSAVRFCRRLFYPVYFLLFSLPIIAYALNERRHWLHLLSGFTIMHFGVVIGIVMQDD